jgi:adenosine deaminase CECR1
MTERNHEVQDGLSHTARDVAAARRLVDAHEANMLSIDPRAGIGSWQTLKNPPGEQHAFGGAEEYFASRERLLKLEQTLDFDHKCRMEASALERRVDSIIRHLKRQDTEEIYSRAETRRDVHGQRHPRFAGDHFLSNVDLIHSTQLFKVARQMPKGGHLHIHFNSCLRPNVLLDIAKGMDRMFITSTLPLVDRENLRDCEIQFSMLKRDKETPGNLFQADYVRGRTMRFRDFLEQFPAQFSGQSADAWLESKIVFEESEAHNYLQTASGYVSRHLIFILNNQCPNKLSTGHGKSLMGVHA